MRPTAFQIRGYKSIEESGICNLASDITVLAGKNESGKSAVLEALRDFDPQVEHLPDECRHLREERAPEIDVTFRLEKEIWNSSIHEVEEELGMGICRKSLPNDITLRKHADGQYSLVGVPASAGHVDVAVESALDSKIHNMLNDLHNLFAITRGIEWEPVENAAESVALLETALKRLSATLSANFPHALPPQAAETISALQKLKSYKTSGSWLASSAAKHLPRFIYFSDFSDILPFEITIDRASESSAVRAFAAVAGLDLQELAQMDPGQRRRNLLSQYSAQISGQFSTTWLQDKIDLVVEADGDLLRFGVKESGRPEIFKAEQRSKGFQWFLSFYLKLAAEAADCDSVVLLVDEPGLYLHAKAQSDVLAVLTQRSGTGPVVYSTHSPYLIDTDRLDRVRLITKTPDKGTTIENKAYKGADQETLKPIITAIGLDLGRACPLVGKKNVILEGISDYYYIQALRFLVHSGCMSDVSFIPAVGAGQTVTLASLLIGWGIDFVVALDNDGEGNKVAGVLKRKLSISDRSIVRVGPTENSRIEDLFSKEDFDSHVLVDSKNNTALLTPSG